MAKIQPVKLEGKFHFLGGLCEISINFKQKITNAPLNVNKQAFALKYKDSNNNLVEKSLRVLKPFSPTGNKVGEYKITFLSEGLTPGDYQLEAKGYPPDYKDESDAIIYQEDIQIYQVDNVESLINMLRVDLSDFFVNLFLIDDETLNRYQDSELYIHLQRSVERYNETPPISRGTLIYNLDDFPHIDILLMGAKLIALDSKAILEIYNKLQYSDDITFSLNRYADIMQYLQYLTTQYTLRVEKIKKDALFRMTSMKAVRSTKIPTRALRSLSFTPQFSFLSAAY